MRIKLQSMCLLVLPHRTHAENGSHLQHKYRYNSTIKNYHKLVKI